MQMILERVQRGVKAENCFDPDKKLEVRDEVIEHTRKLV